LQASLSEQIRDVRKMITNTGSTATPSVTVDMTGEQRLEKIEKTHQNILQMLDDLKRRVEQLEINKQTISAVRYTYIDRKKKDIFFPSLID
jgi:hypothetical protein